MRIPRVVAQLLEIKSPGAVILGTQPPTPRWVENFWSVYDAIASLSWGLFAAFCVVAPITAAVIVALLLTR
jgi:hypothetical protein